MWLYCHFSLNGLPCLGDENILRLKRVPLLGIDDIEEAESVGNMRSVAKLTRMLALKDRHTSCNPSKGAYGRTFTTTTQLLSEWGKFLGVKFQRPTADAERNLENLDAEEDVLGYDELGVCLKALHSGKAMGCDDVLVEPYRGSVHATNELFRRCRMMWHSDRIPPELVGGGGGGTWRTIV